MSDKPNLEKIMDRVRNLLARADHPNTPPPEADLCRERAEKYIREYRIAEEELRADGSLAASAITPGEGSWFITYSNNDYSQSYLTMMSYVAYHTGIKWVYDTEWIDGQLAYVAGAIGFESDLRYAEMLYQSAHVTFADRMEPKYDSNLSDEDNVFRMRNAGIERPRIG
jgi:hypothetical protein